MLPVVFEIYQGVQRAGGILSPIALGLITTASGVESGVFLGGATLLGAVSLLASVKRHLRCPGHTI